MKTGDIQLIRSNQGLTESPSQESVMLRVAKEKTSKNIEFKTFFRKVPSANPDPFNHPIQIPPRSDLVPTPKVW